jgi:hypothetical protein
MSAASAEVQKLSSQAAIVARVSIEVVAEIVHTFTLILLSLVLLVQFLRFSCIAVVDGV